MAGEPIKKANENGNSITVYRTDGSLGNFEKYESPKNGPGEMGKSHRLKPEQRAEEDRLKSILYLLSKCFIATFDCLNLVICFLFIERNQLLSIIMDGLLRFLTKKNYLGILYFSISEICIVMLMKF